MISSCGKYVLKTLLLNLDVDRAKKLVDIIKLYVDSNIELESRIRNYWNSVYNMLKKKFSFCSKKTVIENSQVNDVLIIKMGDEPLSPALHQKTGESSGNFKPYFASSDCFGFSYANNKTSPKLTSTNMYMTSSVSVPFKGSSIIHKGGAPKNISMISKVKLGDAMKKATFNDTSVKSMIQEYMVKSTSYSRLNYYEAYSFNK